MSDRTQNRASNERGKTFALALFIILICTTVATLVLNAGFATTASGATQATMGSSSGRIVASASRSFMRTGMATLRESSHKARSLMGRLRAARLDVESDDGADEYYDNYDDELVPEYDPEDYTDYSDDAYTQEPTLRTIENSLQCVDGHIYVVRVTYDDAAGIPDGAQIKLVELNEALTKEEAEDPVNRFRPYDTERFVGTAELAKRGEVLDQYLNMQEGDWRYATKYLDVTLVDAEGNAISPVSPVEVTFETTFLPIQQSGTLELAWQLPVTNPTPEDPYGYELMTLTEMTDEVSTKATFTTDHFGELAVAGVARVLSDWDVEDCRVQLLGPKTLSSVDLQGIDVDTGKEGWELREAYYVNVDPSPWYGTTMWLSSTPLVETDDLGYLRGFRVRDGVLAGKIFAKGGTAEPVSFRVDEEGYALVWDTEYRHQSLTKGKVQIEGLMPQGTELNAKGMVKVYSDPSEISAELVEKAEGEGIDLSTAAAYDINLSAAGQDYQPDADKPVTVSISSVNINEGGSYQVWHLLDDGSVEVIGGVTVTGNTVSFEATSFSTYLVIQAEEQNGGDTPESCTVTFVDYDDSELLATKSYPYGTDSSAIDTPETPTREGFTFVRWNPELTSVTENVTYKATYLKTVTITAGSDHKIYDGTALTKNSYTSEGLNDGDRVENVTITGSQTVVGTSNNVASAAKIVDAAGHDVTSNYDITYIDGLLEVTKAAATVKADAQNKTYGQADPQLTATVTGLVGEDTIIYSLTRAEGEDVGTYAITAAGESDQGNYTVTYEPANLTIQPAAVTVAADAKTKVYGDDDPDLTATITGLVDGESESLITYSISRVEGDNVGNYAITPSGETVQGNYKVTFTPNTLTITRARLTVKANDASKTYGEADPALTATVTGLKNGDQESVVNYDIERDDEEDAGTYDITPTGDDVQGNYTVVYEVGTFTINPKPVAVTINGESNTTEYDAEEHSVSGYDVTTSVAAYTEDSFTFSGTSEASRTDAGTTKMGLTPDQFSNNDPNYAPTFTVTDGYQTITPISGLKVKITGSIVESDYDGDEHIASGFTATTEGRGSTFYNPDEDVSFSGIAEAERTNVGTSKMGLSVEQFENTNNNFENVVFEITDGFVNINPLEGVIVIITGESETVDYDGEEHTVVGYSASSESSLYDVSSDFTFVGTDEVKRTDAGTSNMGLAATQFTNTNENFKDVTFEVTDGYLTITPIEATVIILGHNDTVDYDGNEHIATGYDVSIDAESLYKEEYITFSGSAVAKGTNAGTYQMNLDASQFGNNSGNFSTVTFEITDGSLTINKIDATVTVIGHKGTFNYDGEVHTVQGYDVSFSTPLYCEEDYDFSGPNEVSRTDAGTSDMNLDASQFMNTNQNFKDVTFDVTDGWITVNPEIIVSKTLNNILSTGETFTFNVELRDDEDQPIVDYTLAEGIPATDLEGKTTFDIPVAGVYANPNNKRIVVPLEATITIAEDKTYDPNNYHTTVTVNGDEREESSATLYTLTDSLSTVAFANAKAPICRIGETEFQTISSAIQWAQAHNEHEPVIEMLVDYTMPASDAVLIPNGYTVTLVTASEYEGISASIKRAPGFTDVMITNHGTLNLGDAGAGIILDGNDVQATQAMVSSSGIVNVNATATISNAKNTGDGGAIESTGTVNVQGGTLSDNKATRGGAIFASDGSVNISSGTVSGNEAGNGGAIYVDGAATEVSGGSISGNTATTGDGGAIYSTGTVSVIGGTVANNRAESGLGGAIYVTGGFNISSGTIGGEGSANRAQNGSAIYVGAGSATITGGIITGNVATSSTDEGGAIGVASESVTLSFSGLPKVYGNTNAGGDASSVRRNVCLSVDSALVINSNGLTVTEGDEDNTAYIGVYVPGNGDLYNNRGVSKARFGRYTTTEGITAFHNDRTPGMSVSQDNSWLQWGKGITIIARYMDGLSTTRKPPANYNNSFSVTYTDYYPANLENYISDIAATVETSKTIKEGGKTVKPVFAAAYASENSDFNDNLSMLNWDATAGTWSFIRRQGGPAITNVETLYLYYDFPAYISVANNTDYTYDISEITINGVPVLQNGYGFMVAKNGVTVPHFEPLSANDFHLKKGESIKLVFPGVRNKTYIVSGRFSTVPDGKTVAYAYDTAINNGTTRQTITPEEPKSAQEANEGFSVTGNTFNNSNTIDIVFGKANAVCKIVEHMDDGSFEEHLYSSLAQAVNDAHEHYEAYSTEYQIVDLKKRAKENTVYNEDGKPISHTYRDENKTIETVVIELLQDYLIPSTDAPSIPSGESYTFTTAKKDVTYGEHYYEGESEDGRAIISRDQGNTSNFITVGTGGDETEVHIENLKFDGKQMSSGDGGVINARNCEVTISNCEVKNFKASNGGAVFLGAVGNPSTGDPCYLAVWDCVFDNCESTGGTRAGGGAIWTSAKEFRLSNCQFTNCICTGTGTGAAQGGGVFHRIDPEWAYAKDSVSTIADSNFEHCNALAGGGMEIDSYSATMDCCWFFDCQARIRNGGGFNAYPLRGESAGTNLRVENSTFTECFAQNNGGGFRTAYETVMVKNSVFTNNTANAIPDSGNNDYGGGGVQKQAGTGLLTLDHCTITGNKSGKIGGGVYCASSINLCNGTSITENSLTNNVVNNAGGLYFNPGKNNANRLTIGSNDGNPDKVDTIIINNNTTLDGSRSNLYLPGTPNANTVVAASSLSSNSKIYVINAAAAGTQFGSVSGVTNPSGYGTAVHAFYGDYNNLYGVLKRSDKTKVVWRGDPIAKITDADGVLLYLDQAHSDAAVFDTLDNGSNNYDEDSAFGRLKRAKADLQLYYYDGTRYTGNDFCVKMLDSYTMSKFITITTNQTWQNITFTTASESDRDIAGGEKNSFPFRSDGDSATVTRGTGVGNNPMIKNYGNLTIGKLTLDGNSAKITVSCEGGIISSQNSKTILDNGAILQNSKISGRRGGGVYVTATDSGSSAETREFEAASTFEIRAGACIKNCETTKNDGQGGGFFQKGRAILTLSGGTITGCKSAKEGGGVHINNGKFIMTDGSIENCSANSGGAISFGANKNPYPTLYMSGGRITGNSAVTGGAMTFDNKDCGYVYFSGNVYIYDNTKDDGTTQCNIELNRNKNTLINTFESGLGENAQIGVYVPGDDNTEPYKSRGGEGDTFGTRTAESSINLFLFVNDINGLRGEREGADKIKWVKMQELTVSKEVVSELTTDNNKDFSVTVTLSDTSVNGYRGITGERGMYFKNGVASFAIKNGQSKTALYVPSGGGEATGTYTITETPHNDFNTLTNGEEKEGNTVTGDFSNPEILVHSVVYKNTRKTGTLKITKNVDSHEPSDDEKEFSFRVQLSYPLTGTYGEGGSAITFEKGVATFTLKNGSSKVATRLPTGITYTVTETSDADFDVTTTINGIVQTPTDVSMLAGNNSIVFTNKRKVGGLTVAKTVSSDAEKDRVNQSFNFTVTLNDSTINGTYNTDAPEGERSMMFENGVAKFQLKNGESVTARGLPQGLTYTVSEEDVSGFTNTRKTNYSGRIGTSIITSSFTNTRQTGRLAITKAITSDRYADRNEKFTFKVKLGNTVVNQGTGESTFVVDKTINKTYSSVPFTNGVGHVEITGRSTKTISGLPQGIEYVVEEDEKTNFELDQNLTTNTTGTINATQSTATFTNVRKTGELQITKTVVSDVASDKETLGFTFTIRLGDTRINKTYYGKPVGEDGRTPTVFTGGVATIQLKNGETRVIQGLPTDVTYTVTEAQNNNFTTESTGTSGTIATDAAMASFTNTRKKGDLSVSKTTKSDISSDLDKKFTFTVKLDDSSVGRVTEDNPGGATYGEGDSAMTFKNGEATFKLSNGESKEAIGLPYGVRYTVTETADDSFAISSKKSTGLITTTKSEAEFTNTRKAGKLILQKVVNSDLSKDSSSANKYVFDVYLGTLVTESGAETFVVDESINKKYGNYQFTNGIAKGIEIQGGKKITIPGFEQGLAYKVVETPAGDMETTSTGAIGTIMQAEDATAIFTNTRLTGNLKVSKTLVSDLQADTQKEFSFTVQLGDKKIEKTYQAVDSSGQPIENGVQFSRGKATFTLKGGESITIKDLPRTVDYAVTEAADESFNTIKTGSTGTIVDDSAEGTPTPEATFTNTRKTNSLVVTKRVESSYASDRDVDFGFIVTLSDKTIGAGSDGKTYDAELVYNNQRTEREITFHDGAASFALKKGQSLEIKGLPTSVGYVVTEQEASGFTTTSTGDSGTIDANQRATATFINKRDVHAICKITDADGTLLYFKDDDGVVWPAVYETLPTAFATFTTPAFFTDSGATKAYGGTSYHVETLISSCELDQGVAVPANLSVTLTTADKGDTDGYPGPFDGTPATVSTITRSNEYGSMLTTRGSLIVTNIALDGAKASYASTENGGIATVPDGGSLTIQSGATLQNSLTNLSGGAVYVANGGTVAMSAGTVTGNVSNGDGAGIYLAEGSVLYLSGNPSFGTAGNVKSESLSGKTNGGDEYLQPRQDIFIAGYEGEDSVAISLVIAGDLNNDETGTNDGSIWVWAEKAAHNKKEMQFAVVQSGVTLANEEASLKVFRNALDDDASENPNATSGEYLYGVTGAVAGNVYWKGPNGSRVVVLRKVLAGNGSTYSSLAGATFDIYPNVDSTNPVKDKNNNVLENLVSGDNGVFYVGELGYGVYYLAEKSLEGSSSYDPADRDTWLFYKMTVNEDGYTFKNSQGKDITLGVTEGTAYGTYIEYATADNSSGDDGGSGGDGSNTGDDGGSGDSGSTGGDTTPSGNSIYSPASTESSQSYYFQLEMTTAGSRERTWIEAKDSTGKTFYVLNMEGGTAAEPFGPLVYYDGNYYKVLQRTIGSDDSKDGVTWFNLSGTNQYYNNGIQYCESFAVAHLGDGLFHIYKNDNCEYTWVKVDNDLEDLALGDGSDEGPVTGPVTVVLNGFHPDVIRWNSSKFSWQPYRQGCMIAVATSWGEDVYIVWDGKDYYNATQPNGAYGQAALSSSFDKSHLYDGEVHTYVRGDDRTEVIWRKVTDTTVV